VALRIPFNRVSVVGSELAYVSQALEQGHISGDGPFSQRCETWLERELGAPRVLLTTSCTHALELSALLLEIEPGDEVIVPAFTFASSATAFSLRGARVVFCDIHDSTLNLDERMLETLVTERTKAVVAVHYAGVGCEMDAILAIAERTGLAIVEDNAHGLFGRYHGKPLGTFGVLATQSFHETKNCTCGEGGALVVNDPRLASRGEVLREKGTNRKAFFRGEVDKYTWVDEGSSYVPSDMLAAFLAAQLEASDVIQAARRRLWHAYADGLGDWAASVGARLPYVPDDREQPYHMFYVLLPSLAYRTALIGHLRTLGIGAVFHYLPLNASPMGERHGGRRGQCPVTEDVSDRLLRVPFYVGLDRDEQDEVIEAIVEFGFREP
jgi:dTDP-4-amino-4,6-dideoxygalactose transaminase